MVVSRGMGGEEEELLLSGDRISDWEGGFWRWMVVMAAQL